MISIRRIDDSADLVPNVHWKELLIATFVVDTICELARLATYATAR